MKSLMIDDESHKKFKDYCEKNRLVLIKELKFMIDNHVDEKVKICKCGDNNEKNNCNS